MLPGIQTNTEIVSANAAAALTQGQTVVLSYSSNALVATAAGAGDRVDGVVIEPTASGESAPIRLQPGTFLSVYQAAGAISANGLLYAAASGRVSSTANGQYLGVALTAASNAGELVVGLAKASVPNAKTFTATAAAGDATNGYIEFTHSFGANPAGWIAYATNGSTGAPRVIASVTNISTSVVRVTVTSLAANDIVTLHTVRATV
jgi:hypothetical protein